MRKTQDNLEKETRVKNPWDFLRIYCFFPRYPLAERQLARKMQDNLEKETRVKNPLGQDESFSKMML